MYAVGCAGFHKEFDEVSKVFNEVVIVFVRFDVAQEDYVVCDQQQHK